MFEFFKFETIFDKLDKSIKQFFRDNKMPNKPNSFRPYLFIILILVIGYFLTGVRKINMEQQGVVLRFGQLHRIMDAGLHYSLPYPFEKVILVDSSSVRRIENTTIPMLTGDENIASVKFYALWNIKDPAAFLFGAKSPEATIKAALDSIMREIIAQNPFDQILTISRDHIAQKAHKELQIFVDKCGLGVQILEVQLGMVDPPAEKVYMNTDNAEEEQKQECVIDAYREVQRAKADFERSCNDADSYENYIIPTSRGKAEKIKQEAYSYQIRVMAQANGSAQQFKLLSNVYNQNPEVVTARLNKEYRQMILKNSKQVIIGDQSKNTPVINLTNIPVSIDKTEAE